MPKSVEELFDGSAFDLASDTPAEQQAPEAQAAPEQVDAAAPEQTPAAPEAQPEPGEKPEAAAGQDKGAPPPPEDNDGRDPAFGRLRKERNDYREQRDAEKLERVRAEERLSAQVKAFETMQAEMQQLRQMMTAQIAPQQPPPQQKQLPNPIEDPNGYLSAVRDSVTAEVSQKLINQSAAYARQIHGPEKVEEAHTWFAKNVPPGSDLDRIVRADSDPFGFLVSYVAKVKAQQEIGDDPAAYKAKVEAELREKVEAEIRAQLSPQQAAPTRQPANPNLPPSLGRVPNAGARSTTYTGPAPIEALWDS